MIGRLNKPHSASIYVMSLRKRMILELLIVMRLMDFPKVGRNVREGLYNIIGASKISYDLLSSSLL